MEKNIMMARAFRAAASRIEQQSTMPWCGITDDGQTTVVGAIADALVPDSFENRMALCGLLGRYNLSTQLWRLNDSGSTRDAASRLRGISRDLYGR